jgi:hypothetical protein
VLVSDELFCVLVYEKIPNLLPNPVPLNLMWYFDAFCETSVHVGSPGPFEGLGNELLGTVKYNFFIDGSGLVILLLLVP